MRRFLLWFFKSRETGAITIAQTPNLALWIVILASVLIWVWHPPGRLGFALEIIAKSSLLVWAIDDVNPWRRCIGVTALSYGLATLGP